MRRFTYVVISCAMLVTGVALGKLPAPSPEEQAAAAAKKAKADEQIEKEKTALARAQDRVAERNRKEKGGSGGQQVAGRTSTENLPKTIKEPPQGVGPRPGMQQSAEAHSAPAK